MDFLPFASVAMSAAGQSPGQRQGYLSRRLAREKAACPGCGKVLQVGTLAWAHKCRGPKAPPSDQVVEARLVKMIANATRKHEGRMANHTRTRSRSRGAAELPPDTNADLSSPESGTEVGNSFRSADGEADHPGNSC